MGPTVPINEVLGIFLCPLHLFRFEVASRWAVAHQSGVRGNAPLGYHGHKQKHPPGRPPPAPSPSHPGSHSTQNVESAEVLASSQPNQTARSGSWVTTLWDFHDTVEVCITPLDFITTIRPALARPFQLCLARPLRHQPPELHCKRSSTVSSHVAKHFPCCGVSLASPSLSFPPSWDSQTALSGTGVFELVFQLSLLAGSSG